MHALVVVGSLQDTQLMCADSIGGFVVFVLRVALSVSKVWRSSTGFKHVVVPLPASSALMLCFGVQHTGTRVPCQAGQSCTQLFTRVAWKVGK